MLTITKLSSFPWCYKDGGEPDEKLSQDQLERKIVEFPSLLKFLSYIFFYGRALIGPGFDYSEYSEFIEFRKHYANIPNSFLPSLKNFINAFAMLGMLIFLNPFFDPKKMDDISFSSKPFWLKILFFNVGGFLVRARFYSGWLLANANCIMAGLSYNGKNEDKEEKWDRVSNVKALQFEFSDTVRDRLDSWNHSVHNWLKRYVFVRVAPEAETKKNPRLTVFAANGNF